MLNEGLIVNDSTALVKSEIVNQIRRLGATTPVDGPGKKDIGGDGCAWRAKSRPRSPSLATPADTVLYFRDLSGDYGPIGRGSAARKSRGPRVV